MRSISATCALLPALLSLAALAALPGCSDDDDGDDESPPGPTPTVPSLLGPQQDAHVGSVRRAETLRPTFRWSASTSEVHPQEEIEYQFELSADPTFAMGVVMQRSAALAYTPAMPLEVSATRPVGTRYYWRVRACVAEACSEPSRIRAVNLGRSPRDFNGDGYADVLVGASGEGPSGVVRIFSGGSGNIFDPDPTHILTGNGEANEGFGASTAFVGDLNADGFTDIAVGAPYSDVTSLVDAGRVYLYFGRANEFITPDPAAVLEGTAAEARFGETVAAAGDANGDGFADLLVGARGGQDGSPAGAAYLYRGGAGKTFSAVVDQKLQGQFTSFRFGTSVAAAGDVDNDGYADVLVGQPLVGTGVAHLFFGQPSAANKGDLVSRNNPLRIEGTQGISGFGKTVAAAGDVNGDGLADFIIGSDPIAYVYLGGEKRSVNAVPDGRLSYADSPGVSSLIADSVAAAGDLDGDGLSDLLIGAPTGTTASATKGLVHIFYGSRGPALDEVADQLLGGLAPGDRFGASVAGAGDLNDDGFADVIVGAPTRALSELRDGAAFVYFSGPGGALREAGVLEAIVRYSQFGGSVASGPL